MAGGIRYEERHQIGDLLGLAGPMFKRLAALGILDRDRDAVYGRSAVRILNDMVSMAPGQMTFTRIR